LVIHGGAVHFSKDSLSLDGRLVFGRVKGTECWLTGLSQEHGILEHSGTLYMRTHIGDHLRIYPVHSCLAANLMRRYRTLEGEWIETMNS
jgi:D-serine deaminase-like pyridoxal phosphate-dependent protein